MLYPGNQILHRGSGGAAHNFMVVYDYSGTDLTMTEGVVMADEDHYYEITGETENIFDERLPGDTQITREEYFARTDVMEANEVLLQLQPLQERRKGTDNRHRKIGLQIIFMFQMTVKAEAIYRNRPRLFQYAGS